MAVKSLDQMLRQLERPEVAELVLSTRAAPRLKVGTGHEPLGEVPMTSDGLLAMLVTCGGSRFVDGLDTTPVAWSMRVAGVGLVLVTAVRHDGVLEARFRAATPPKREPDRRSVGKIKAAKAAGDSVAPAPKKGSVPPSSAAARGAIPPKPAQPPVRVRGKSVMPPRIAPQTDGDPLAALVTSARRLGASDLHLGPGRPAMFRIANELSSPGDGADSGAAARALEALVPERLRSHLAEVGACRFTLDHEKLGRVRVQLTTTDAGPSAVLRPLRPEPPSLAGLSLPDQVAKLTQVTAGLVLVCGPRGSGRTSTLQAMIDAIARESARYVVSLEDPIETLARRRKARIAQRELGTHVRSFERGVAVALREDADVIALDELRTADDARAALGAAQAGRLVLACIRGERVTTAIDAMTALFPSAERATRREELAACLVAVVGQHLLQGLPGVGAVAAVEVLSAGAAVGELVRRGRASEIPRLSTADRGAGSLRLDDALVELVRGQRIAPFVALANADEQRELEALLPKGAPPVAQTRRNIPQLSVPPPELAMAVVARTSEKGERSEP